MIINSTLVESNKSFLVHRLFDTPQPVRIPLESDDVVSPVQIVAQTNRETGYEIVPVAEVFNLSTDDISSYLAVSEGDEVRLGTLLAERRRTFGRSQHITSKVEGTVSEIIDGNIFISRKPEDLNLRALVSGRVAEAIYDKGIAIEVKGSRIQGVWSNGLESAGQLRIQADAPDAIATTSFFDQDLYGSIVVLGHADDVSLLERMAEAGARGAIAGTISPDLFHAAAEWPYPFVLTDGVGSGGMYPRFFQLLSENSGKDVALFNGKFSLSNRADIVITGRNPEEDQSAYRRSAPKKAEVRIGQSVRVLTGGKRGQTGTIVKLYSWPQTIASGIKAHGVDIQFESEESTFIPLANLDIIM